MNILVIGDSCIDLFVYGVVDRICPEAPVPVLIPLETKENDGMSMNVVNNLVSLGANVDSLTNKDLIEKVRYVDQKTNQMLLRMDTYDSCERCDLSDVEWNKYDAVIVSDYNKGFLQEEDVTHICSSHDFVFIDTKKRLGDWISGAKYIKLNQYEYAHSKDYIDKNIQTKSKIIVTHGGQGCYYGDRHYPPKKPAEVKDACGAGDTFLAGFTVHIMKYGNIKKAINFAQKCAGDVIGRVGVVATRLKEL